MYKNKLLSNLNSFLEGEGTAAYAIIFSLVIQAVLAFYFWNTNLPPSDSTVYISLAESCVNAGQWYPTASHLYSNYLFAPGLVNLLVILIHLFSTWKAVVILNMALNAGIAWCIYCLGNRFFSKKVGCLALIVWSLLYSNWFSVLSASTEVPFLFFVLSAFTLCVLHKDSAWVYVLAGVFLILGNYIRPLSTLFLAAIIVYMILHRVKVYQYVLLVIPCVVGALILGQVSKANTGFFAYQSSTSGVNLIMTSHDKAYGGVNTSIFADTTSICYIKNAKELTFAEKDSIWKARAFQWIKSHPVKVAILYVKKIGGMWVEDSWSDRPVMGGSGAVDKGVNGGDWPKFIQRIIHMASHSVLYYAVCIIFLADIIKERKIWIRNWKTEGVLLLLLCMGIGVTCLFSVSPRYHYPYIFIVVLFASRSFINYLERRAEHD